MRGLRKWKKWRDLPKNESPVSDHLMSSSVLGAFTNLGEKRCGEGGDSCK